MGKSASQNLGTAVRVQAAYISGGLSEAAIYQAKKMGIGASPGDAQGQQTLAERNRLKGLLTEDNLQYFTPEQRKAYQEGLNLQQGQIAPQDEFNYYKSKADALEAAIAANRERAQITQQQIKFLLENPGGKQTKNADYLLQNAVKAPESILTAGQKAQEASKQGSILG